MTPAAAGKARGVRMRAGRPRRPAAQAAARTPTPARAPATVGAAYDAVVVGLGIMGAAALRALALRGARVAGLERFRPGHDRGSSHGDSRIIRTAYFEDPSYVPLVEQAWEMWRELEAAAGAQDGDSPRARRLLLPTGALMIGRPDSPVVAGTLESARRWRLPHEVLDASALRRRFPAFAPPEGAVAVYEEKAGALHPEACLAALLDDARRHGAEVRSGLRVLGWEEAGGGRLRVRAGPADRSAAAVGGARGTAAGALETAPGPGGILARRVILCAGPWTADLLGDRIPLRVERQVMHWFRMAGAPDDFRPGRMPVFIWHRQDGAQFYGFPTLDDEVVKFCRHHGGEETTPEAVERAIRQEDVAPVEEARRALLPGLEPLPVRSKTCLYTNTPDGNFCIGPLPEDPRVVVAAGFSGHGFKFAPVVGEILAQLALAGRTRDPVELFALDRFRAKE